MYLNRQDEFSLLSSEDEEEIAQSEVCNTFLFCLNYVIKRIATDFCFCRVCENIQIEDNYYYLQDLQNNLFSVIQLKNVNGVQGFYEDGVGIKANSGDYTLTYAYMPPDFNFLDDITCFPSCVNEDVVALGVVAHYFLISGYYSEHNTYEEKFLDRINLLTNKKSEKVVKGKIWQ